MKFLGAIVIFSFAFAHPGRAQSTAPKPTEKNRGARSAKSTETSAVKSPAKPAVDFSGEPFVIEASIANCDRAVGARLAGELGLLRAQAATPADVTIRLTAGLMPATL